mmetsp:Transcript_21710/g.50380  ORF Transcript_21710/g.50380 Transcript_21710/m.50380 type:complete len:107 (-) Transcript_21710:777-1097(-)
MGPLLHMWARLCTDNTMQCAHMREQAQHLSFDPMSATRFRTQGILIDFLTEMLPKLCVVPKWTSSSGKQMIARMACLATPHKLHGHIWAESLIQLLASCLHFHFTT